LRRRADGADAAQDLEPVHARHPQIEQHQAGRPLAEVRERADAVDRRGDVETLALRDGPDQRENGAVVVDDQQPRTLGLHACL